MKFKTTGHIQGLSGCTKLPPFHMTPSWCLPLQPHFGVEFQHHRALWGGALDCSHRLNSSKSLSSLRMGLLKPLILSSRWIWSPGITPGWQHRPAMASKETWQLSSARSKLFIHSCVLADITNGVMSTCLSLVHKLQH